MCSSHHIRHQRYHHDQSWPSLHVSYHFSYSLSPSSTFVSSGTFMCLCVFLFHFILYILIGNVAYTKHASAQKFWNDFSNIPGRAVDGDIDGDYKKCYRSDDPSSSAWWMVDLGAPHVIYNVTVYGTSTRGMNKEHYFIHFSTIKSCLVTDSILD